MRGRWLLAGLIGVVVGACYSNRVMPTTPEPNTKVSVVLSDQGRVETARSIGPSTERVEGRLLVADDTAYLMAVSSVKPLRGPWVRWSGEQVSVRRDYVAGFYERRLNKGRTALAVGLGTWVLLAAMVRFDILGFGALDIPLIPGGPGDPGDQ